MRSFKILRGILYAVFAFDMVMSRPDCNPESILGNVIRVCKSYASIKRSTQGNNFEDFDNMIEIWAQVPQRQQSPSFSNINTFSLDQDRQRHGDAHAPNPFLQQQQPLRRSHHRRYKEMTLPYPSYNQQNKNGDVFEMEKSDWDNRQFQYLVDPIYWDEEQEITVERWRRNEQIIGEINKFIHGKCCRHGCTFPNDFLEFDRRTNICNLR